MSLDPNADLQKSPRRFSFLQALRLRPQHTATPASLLHELENCGYPLTLTRLMGDVAFLTSLGLIVAPDAGFLSLTDEGLGVAKGIVNIPGIGSPALGEKG
ncbi:MAG: hypothetical protein LBS89_06700 [Zoogloeaceae bacterium]|jgi:hypothetical protein|nr:hypothetical protein [Zoogloeaceae bacterium]